MRKKKNQTIKKNRIILAAKTKKKTSNMIRSAMTQVIKKMQDVPCGELGWVLKNGWEWGRGGHWIAWKYDYVSKHYFF